jgi:hypothetical protein
VYLKSIGDCIGSRDESIDTHLDPPLFWLDIIFQAHFAGFPYSRKAERVRNSVEREGRRRRGRGESRGDEEVTEYAFCRRLFFGDPKFVS